MPFVVSLNNLTKQKVSSVWGGYPACLEFFMHQYCAASLKVGALHWCCAS